MSRHLDGTGSGHPVLGFLDLLEASLDDVTDAPMWSLGAVETTQVITRLSADLARLAELEARALLHADTLDLAGEIGARSLAAWLARTTRVTMGEARRKTRLAETLAAHDPTRAAVAKGEVLAEQAAVIGSVIDELAEQYADRKGEVEDYLIGKAADFDAHGLKELGRKVVEVIDPAGADAAEAKRLEEQEKRALKRTELTMSNRGDGTVRGTFILPEATAEMLRKALLAFAAPKHVRATEGAGSYDHERPTPQKMGWAFISYIENYPTDRLPKMGGVAATIIVTVDADVFTQQGTPAGAEGRHDRGRGPGLTRHPAPLGLLSQGHARRARRRGPRPRPRADPTAAHRGPAPRLDRGSEDVSAPVVRHVGRVLPRSPHHPLGGWRSHEHPSRRPALPLPPPPGPHPARHLPSADVDRPWRSVR